MDRFKIFKQRNICNYYLVKNHESRLKWVTNWFRFSYIHLDVKYYYLIGFFPTSLNHAYKIFHNFFATCLSVKPKPTHKKSLKRLQRKFISIESVVEEPISKVTNENENREDERYIYLYVVDKASAKKWQIIEIAL